MRIEIRIAAPGDDLEWLRMRRALWPDAEGQHQAEMDEWMADPDKVTLVAVRPGGGLAGFLEAALRPYADGCETRPVGYIEGWYVDPDLRRHGVGAELVHAAEEWARSKGCREMASDTELENETSQRAHLALGYQEAERLVHYRKWL